MASADGKMQRYIESSASTISTLTKKIAVLEAKVNNSETNYIVVLRKMTELETENKELKRQSTACFEKLVILEVSFVSDPFFSSHTICFQN